MRINEYGEIEYDDERERDAFAQRPAYQAARPAYRPPGGYNTHDDLPVNFLKAIGIVIGVILVIFFLYAASNSIPRITNTSRPIPVPPPVINEPPKPVPPPPSAPEPDLVGNSAPAFALQDLNGGYVRLSDFQGKAVVLNFWASWCPPCRQEIPHFIELRNKYGDRGLEILGVSVEGEDAEQILQNFAAENGINYPILLGSSAVSKEYGGISAVPTTFLIDANGTVQKELVGYQDLNTWETQVEPLLPLEEEPQYTNSPAMFADNGNEDPPSSYSDGRLLNREPVFPAQPMEDRDAQFVRGPWNRPVQHIRVEFSQAVAIRKVSPVYPRQARIMGIEGKLILRVEVLADGTVGVITFVRAVHPLLDAAAAEAVRRWEFRPAFNGQEPVNSLKIVGIDFQLRR